MLGSLILYFKGMRIMMFQLSGFYFKASGALRSSRGSEPSYFSALRLSRRHSGLGPEGATGPRRP